MNALIHLENISAGYDKNIVLNNVTLDVKDNDFIGIIGPNGGGKTTLLKVILDLLTPISGSVSKAKNLRIGYLPQVNSIDKKFPVTVKDVILTGRFSTDSWWRKPNNKHLTKVNELLDFIGL
ncbi:MAG: ATP-binding cassette domain-containing protein [Carboxylicivirga sp.]|nr:ATP-binding cassette domain-containing protein [Carboxylicivirga sp.]